MTHTRRFGRAPLVLALACLGLLLGAAGAEAQTGVLFVEGGNVGVSVETPTSALHVKRSNGTARITVEETAPTVQNRTLFSLINNGGPMFSVTNANSGQAWSFHTGGARFNISLIGSGVDEFRLSPGGNLAISGALTTSGGFYPDYVFEPDYELMPLADLARFIEENGHLPNVPSAEESDGGKSINMTELQLRLLEKVEELTLYTLQQEETLQRQEQVIQALQAQVERLEGQR